MNHITANADFFSSIKTLKDTEITILGDIDLTSENAVQKKLHISNTLAESEKADITKNIGICLVDCENVVIDGNGAKILCHGKLTQLALINCKNVTVKNLSFDYKNPTVTEMKVTEVGNGYIIAKPNDDCPYYIKDDKIHWYGDNFDFSDGISQIFDANTGKTWRRWGPMQDDTAVWSKAQDGNIKIESQKAENPYGVKVGNVLQMRNPIRDENGILIFESENTNLLNLDMHFMHGLGLIAQNSDTITIDKMNCLPSGNRTAACFADFLHFSGCRGKITITNSDFCGAHDDAINIHGTHLKITKVTDNGVNLKFMQSQTFGIDGFNIGDELEAVNPDSLLCVGYAKVESFKVLNPYEVFVGLNNTKGFSEGMFVENVSATASAYIANNKFDRIPTRGILISSRKSIVIENNLFTNLYSAGILIADDARSWYESGPVRDVLIQNNKFIGCTDTVVKIQPENTIISDTPIHSGVRIIGNMVDFNGDLKLVTAKSTKGIVIEDNHIVGKNTTVKAEFNACSDIKINGNTLNGLETEL